MKSGWRGSLAKVVPNRVWQKVISHSYRSEVKDFTLQELRKLEEKKVAIDELNLEVVQQDSFGTVHLTPQASAVVRRKMRSTGIQVVELEKSSVPSNILRAWACTSPEFVGKRSDLVESIGTRIFETVDGRPPVFPNVLDFTLPVDLVYTWVDGNDEQWRRSKADALAATNDGIVATAANDARFISSDELKYSLRSVEAFLPWVNHIYLVTSGQSPVWLKKDHPRITVVHHEDIFRDCSNLPTFNSHAIESQLHRIPGLSEHFIYVNDDVFFGRPLRPEFFFTSSGMARFQLSMRHHQEDAANGLPVNIAASNNNKVLQRRFGMQSSLKFKHVAHPQRKSVLEQIERENPEAVAMTASARFRSNEDLSIPSALAHYYGLALGRSVPGTGSYKYIDLGLSDAQLELAKLLMGKRPQTFCLNQVHNRQDVQTNVLASFLERAFPFASSMEKIAAS